MWVGEGGNGATLCSGWCLKCLDAFVDIVKVGYNEKNVHSCLDCCRRSHQCVLRAFGVLNYDGSG